MKKKILAAEAKKITFEIEKHALNNKRAKLLIKNTKINSEFLISCLQIFAFLEKKKIDQIELTRVKSNKILIFLGLKSTNVNLL